MSADAKLKEILNRVLDVTEDEIKPDETLDALFGVDSTEMVEITVGLKKELNIELESNDLKKTMSFNQIVEVLKSKGAE